MSELLVAEMVEEIEGLQARLDAAQQVVEAARSYRMRRTDKALQELGDALAEFDALSGLQEQQG